MNLLVEQNRKQPANVLLERLEILNHHALIGLPRLEKRDWASASSQHRRRPHPTHFLIPPLP